MVTTPRKKLTEGQRMANKRKAGRAARRAVATGNTSFRLDMVAAMIPIPRQQPISNLENRSKP